MIRARFVDYLEGQTTREAESRYGQWVPPGFAGHVDNYAVGSGEQ
ncbi:hypothetical protein [Mesorhizobium sp. 128a]